MTIKEMVTVTMQGQEGHYNNPVTFFSSVFNL